MDQSELQAENARLQAENARLQASVAAHQQLRLKVSEKGGVSLYGVNSRFPVTLYADQWTRVLEYGTTIKAYIAEHANKLSRKSA